MTTLEESLYSYLKADAGLTALVSTRIYAMRVPQSVSFPCLTIQRISTARIHTHDTSGASNLSSPRFQFDAWAATYSSAKSITDALRAALNGKTGSIGTAPYALTIQSSLVVAETPELDPELDVFRSRSDYIIWYVE